MSVLTPESVKTILKLTENDIVTYEAFIKGQAFASTEYTAHPEKYGATEHSLNYVKKTRILKDDIMFFFNSSSPTTMSILSNSWQCSSMKDTMSSLRILVFFT